MHKLHYILISTCTFATSLFVRLCFYFYDHVEYVTERPIPHNVSYEKERLACAVCGGVMATLAIAFVLAIAVPSGWFALRAASKMARDAAEAVDRAAKIAIAACKRSFAEAVEIGTVICQEGFRLVG